MELSSQELEADLRAQVRPRQPRLARLNMSDKYSDLLHSSERLAPAPAQPRTEDTATEDTLDLVMKGASSLEIQGDDPLVQFRQFQFHQFRQTCQRCFEASTLYIHTQMTLKWWQFP